jgi:energy-coupling factor transport system permease protein
MIGRTNPLARIGAASAVMLALFISLDVVTAAVVIAVDLAVVPLTGIGWRRLVSRAGPLLAAAAVIGLSNGLIAQGGPSPGAGIAVALRVFAVGLTGLLAVLPTDPTDLADALMQDMNLAPRLALSTLASLRLAPLVATDWRTLGLARRARGLDAGGSPGRWLILVGSALLALLTTAIRRATRLAIAMDARGLRAGPRSFARPVVMRASDWLLLAAGIAAAGGAIAVSLALGEWRFLLG